FSWRKLWRFTGPGWLMSLAYLDPGNLESDLQQGGYTGYQLLWVLWWATVMGFLLQEMVARLGIVAGRDLAQTVRSEYPRWLCYVVYVMMECAVIGADIQEVVGSAIALNLLTGGFVPVVVGCAITALDTFTFLAVEYLAREDGARWSRHLVGTMAACFFVNWGQSSTDGAALLKGWAAPLAVSAIGAVIMPHNLYLHSSLVLSRKVQRASKQKVYDAIWYARIESAGALLVAFLINLAVVATNANRFFSADCAEIEQGPYAVPTAWAGRDAALYVWALGLFAAGQSSTMVCTYAGQVIMGGMVQIKLRPWKQIAMTRALALGPALAVAVSTYGDQRLFNRINEYLNVLQSVLLPFAMLPALHFTRSTRILGCFASGGLYSYLTFALAALVIAVNIVLVVEF
ncbi:hypothetical protein EMIHUDRAFT_52098, partial [Emiliania huxleyi CCMP1516]|uniref:Uncharacterized protein n=2 Tax=Emiliania huxleyi TaxID=2903 RepID=A0A0D3I865_EMIH1